MNHVMQTLSFRANFCILFVCLFVRSFRETDYRKLALLLKVSKITVNC